jgi:hypothetical protein
MAAAAKASHFSEAAMSLLLFALAISVCLCLAAVAVSSGDDQGLSGV